MSHTKFHEDRRKSFQVTQQTLEVWRGFRRILQKGLNHLSLLSQNGAGRICCSEVPLDFTGLDKVCFQKQTLQ